MADEGRKVFQNILFSKIVPNCKKLGLLDRNNGWLRQRFTELGVIQFEDWVDTGEEYAMLDEVAKDREPPPPARRRRGAGARRATAQRAARGVRPGRCSVRGLMSVRIVFLGGLGEIGRNCFCLEVDGRILVVDCGIMFPDADMPGIDLVLPDFTYLRDNADRVEAVILTHAHEDHAGGLAFLLRDISVPIYGSALSLALARNRIEEAGMLDRTELITVTDGERRRIGPIDCQFIPVTHSVPHGFAIAFFTPEGTIIHTGDFKLDLTPVDGRHTDLALLGELARRDGGIRLLLSDSTNAERPGFTPSESTVGAAMRALFREHADKRFIVASFASHLHRVEQVAQAAIAHGRKVAFVGRSMLQNVVDGARARLHRPSRRTRSSTSRRPPATRPVRSASSAPVRRASR